MSENQNQPVGEVGPVELVASAGAPEAPAEKPVRRGRIVAVAGSALFAVALVVGVGYTVVTVNGADRDAGAPVWHLPKEDAEKAKAASAKGLSGMLVPFGEDGWSRGPDIAQYGSDAELSGAEATALRKESLSGLPRTQRKQLEKQIDKQRLEGVAMRSYVSTDQSSPIYTDTASIVSIELTRMDNRAAVRNISEAQNEFLDVLGIFRAGPKIKGHKDAGCFLAPADKKEKLDEMYCSAHVGDVLVTVTASSVKPMQTKSVAALVKQQLDRIAEPGEAV
ncbi:hypothetical protein [Streptomyces cylindrosporus]|uniref:Secreted protein n=1 Tax=Streptomyces cylindrosporus TaxID=2927583 RepID=A0ABS9Y6A3_9ACTN|nr:hypothetical protein [Streptomyces cylindrosporus]MCI3272050.1 hypothetical protein [Streptomyces cylindrosporus]